ncbi:MAG: hypothetical protein OXF08_09570, partial [Bacteroidetes bacterium]|nr:hypothetical protein [Bacteroidota bacterium]
KVSLTKFNQFHRKRSRTKSFEEFLSDQSLLVKLTVPISESQKLFYLCNQFNCNAARLFPNAEGACMYSIDKHLSFMAETLGNEVIEESD